MSTGFEESGRTPSETRSSSDSRSSIGELLADVSQDITTLLRQEVELAKAEVKESAARAGKGAGMFAGAGLAGHMVLLFASIAAWWAIGDSTGHGWSALIVAGIWLLIGAALSVAGRSEMKSIRGVPQTTDTVKAIPNAVKGNNAANGNNAVNGSAVNGNSGNGNEERR